MGMRSVDGWGRAIREELRRMGVGRGIVRRADVERELGKRGLAVKVGNGVDAEEEAARRMDEKMEALEGGS